MDKERGPVELYGKWPLHPDEVADYDDDSEFYGMTEEEIEAVKDERLQEMNAMDIEAEKRRRLEMSFSEEGQIALELEALQRMWPFDYPMPDPWE